jgi:sigma-B regulation protein RsbU (phosphoserine phosphatase)
MSDATRSIPPPRLQVDDATGRHIVIVDKPVFRIGRRSESDLRPASVEVSREHAEIIQDNGKYLLKDRGSRFGTFVNDEPITERQLRHRDRIRFGRSGSVEHIFLVGDSGDSHASQVSGLIDFRKISTLLDNLRALGSARVLDEVLQLVMDSAIDATGAERGFIMLAAPNGELEFKIARGRGGITLSGQSFATSQKIPQEVFASGRAQIVADLMDEQVAGGHLGTLALGIRHVLCTPLRVVRYLEQADSSVDHGPIGVLYLDSREKGHLLSTSSRNALETVATEAAGAIESARLYRDATEKARLEHELQLAAEIQRSLLPQGDQSGAHFDVAAASMPCRSIGGDFFDYFHLSNASFGFVLGDAAGKGPPAALLIALIQGAFSSLVASSASPCEVMATVNASLIRRSIQNRFATVVYGALSAEGELTYSNAGHNPPVLLQRGTTRRLDTGGLILGLFPQATYEEETIQLDDGDVLVVFSDGVTEAFNAAGEDFGESRLLECLAGNRDSAPAELLPKILSAVQRFAGTAAQSDDRTALVLKYRRAN